MVQNTGDLLRFGNEDKKPQIIRTFERFFKSSSSGGIVLIIFTVIAMVWANSPWGDSYRRLWESYLTIGFGDWELSKHLIHWINDGLMAIFFFVVGLEIKREILVGELSTLKKAMLPIVGAIGGMAVPALFYYFFNSGTVEIRGWGIPVATDIAFAIGILALLGPRVPIALKVFLTALAIVDDIGAVAIIAIFYTADLSVIMLGIGAGIIIVLMIMNYSGVKEPVFYIIPGIILWYVVLKSGVHATIAGVALAFTIPASSRFNKDELVNKVDALWKSFIKEPNPKEEKEYKLELLYNISNKYQHVQSPLHRLEHFLYPYVSFLIMPVFALANAGVYLSSEAIAGIGNNVSLGIIFGLFVGKQVGITLIIWLTNLLGITSLPEGIRLSKIWGVSLLCGVGFTMSLFVSGLAFGGTEVETYSKMGILIASVIAGITGYFVLKVSLAKKVEA